MSEQTENAERRGERLFVAYLSRQCADKGNKAAMRRGFRRTPDQAHTLHRYMGMVSEVDLRCQAAAYYAVASWVAKFGPGKPGLTLGAAARNTARSPSVNHDAFEKHVSDLGRATPATLISSRLPALLTRMSNAGQTPDLSLLLHDVKSWQRGYRDTIFRQWMTAFYRAAEPASPTPGLAPPSKHPDLHPANQKDLNAP